MDQQTPLLVPTELYDKRRAKDNGRLRAYNKILEQIYHRIRIISRLPQSQAYLLYQIPPFILGLPKLDMEDCSVYLIFQLRHAGYEVRFTFPNLLYISWMHHEKTYLVEQSPIMQSMIESAERTQAEVERKEREASRLLAPRKSSRKVKFQTPGSHASYTNSEHVPQQIPRSAIENVLQRPLHGSNGAQSSSSAGSPPSAGSYVPNATFLQSILSPSQTSSKPKSVPDYFQ
jgi:hypothetical protein